MNKSFKILFVFLLAPIFVSAQEGNDASHRLDGISYFYAHPFSKGPSKNMILLKSEGLLGSNVLNRNMLFTGPNATANEENKSRIENEATKRLGFDLGYELNYVFNRKMGEGNDFSYMTAVVGRRQVMGSLISPDMATLILFGNRSFLGQEKELAFSNLEQVSYNKIGLKKAYVTANSGKRRTVELGVNLLQGNFYQNTVVERGKLFTDSLGETMSGELRGEHAVVGKNTTLNHGGLGAAVDVRFQTTLSGNAALSVELNDAGFIHFKEAVNYSIDSNIVYEGVIVDPNSDQALGFDLRNEYLNSQNSRTLVATPYIFKVKLHYQYSEKDLVEIGIETRNIGAYVQRFRASYARFLGANSNYALISGLDVGGFGQYNWRETLVGQVNESISFQIGVGGIEGLLFNSLPMNSYLDFGIAVAL